jgi:hypothetical protein
MRGKEKEKQTTETSGPIPGGALAKWDHDTSSWRTFQVSFLMDTQELSRENFPKSGTMQCGVLYQQQMSEHRILGRGGGALGSWPTPTATEAGKIGNRPNYGQTGLSNHPAIVGYPEREKMEKSKAWPTPTRRDCKGGGPTIMRKDGKSRLDHLDYLAEYGRQVPQISMDGSKSSENDQTSPQHSRRRLNANFVEWMMGVPVGWTDLKPLETESYQQWLQNFLGGASNDES